LLHPAAAFFNSAMEYRPTVERRELLAIELKYYDHHRSSRSMVSLETGLPISSDSDYSRVPEDSGVESGRLLGLAVKPQAWANSLNGTHAFPPSLTK
jgi:hypothetical protein